MKKLLSIGLACILALTSLTGCGQPAGDDGKAEVKIILVLEDKTEKTYDIEVTNGVTLRDALFEGELITEETYSGFFIDNIDGNIADPMQGVLWLQCDEDGNQLEGTVDEITVEDGQTIKMIFTVAPNFED